jgi:heptosyltransferase II
VQSLVVAPQWIGDAVMSEPLMRRLAARGERLTVGALPWVAPVYRLMPAVAEVQEWPLAHGRLDAKLRWRIASGLRRRFERAYVLPNSIKSALIPWWAGIPERYGYQGEGRALMLNRRLANPAGRAPMVDFYSSLAGLAKGNEASSENAPEPRLQVDPAAQAQALHAHGLTPGGYRAFAPGAEYGPAKCWPAAHYASLAERLIAHDGLPIVLLGSGKEAALAQSVVDAVPAASRARCLNLAGRTSLADALALVSGAQCLVSNDSGLMHVAAAFGIEQVAVFGSTSPEHTPPLNRRAQVLWLKEELGLDCAPCFERQCRFGHTRCLTEVAPERVARLLGA